MYFSQVLLKKYLMLDFLCVLMLVIERTASTVTQASL